MSFCFGLGLPALTEFRRASLEVSGDEIPPVSHHTSATDGLSSFSFGGRTSGGSFNSSVIEVSGAVESNSKKKPMHYASHLLNAHIVHSVVRATVKKISNPEYIPTIGSAAGLCLHSASSRRVFASNVSGSVLRTIHLCCWRNCCERRRDQSHLRV